MSKVINTLSKGEDLVGRGLSTTIGRTSLPIKAAIYQDKVLKDFGEMSEEEVQEIVDKFKEEHPGVLSDTKVRIGAAKPFSDAVRSVKNPRLGIALRALGIPGSIVGGSLSWLDRGSHYNPLADTITLYGKYPDILAHELGHAVDFNRKASDEVKDEWYGSLGRDAYLKGYIASGLLANRYHVNPMTLWTESMANRRAAEALGTEAYRDSRKILWPAFSTYLTAAGLGSLKLHDEFVHKGSEPSPWQRYRGFMDKALPDTLKGTRVGGILASIMTIAPAAIGARVLAEAVNAAGRRMDKRKEQEDE